MYIFGHPKSLFTEKWLLYDVQNQDSFSHDVCSFVVQTKTARNTWFHCSINHTDYHEFVRWRGRSTKRGSTKRGRACSIGVDVDSRLLSSTLVPALLVLHVPLWAIDRSIDNWHIELGVEPMIGVIALFSSPWQVLQLLEVAEFCLFHEDFCRKFVWSWGILSFHRRMWFLEVRIEDVYFYLFCESVRNKFHSRYHYVRTSIPLCTCN